MEDKLVLQNDKNTTEMQITNCVVYGDGAMTNWTCQKWFVKFCAEDFSLDDAPRSGRPVEVDSNQIETLLENNCYTIWEMADILKISQSVKLLVKMKIVSFILWKKPHGVFGRPNNKIDTMAHFLYWSLKIQGMLVSCQQAWFFGPLEINILPCRWK